MAKFLELVGTARYADYPAAAAESHQISGAEAYQRYGRGMIRARASVGRRVV
jgi:hypothetical protein